MKTTMFTLPLALLIAASPALVAAQTAPAKSAAKTTKSAPKAVTKAKEPKLSAAARKKIEEETAVDDDPAVKLTPADLEVAKTVYLGDIPCELGATVHITPHKREGFFIVRTGIQRFRMRPVESKTGAIRLEDPVAGAMWLQLANKSMLMSQKIGKRLADECMSEAQHAMNETLKKNPINILEAAPVKVVAPAAAESPAAAAGTAAAPPATPAAATPAAAAEAPPPAATPAGTAPASTPAAPAATTN